jgi:uncharacterized cupredoxin-like copper-binding protein
MRFFSSPGCRRGALAACLPILLAGCGGSAPRSKARATAAVSLTERDFGISAPTRLPAGEVLLRVDNRGPDAHELIVVPGSAQTLPVRTDGLTVAEEAIEHNEVGALEPGAPGAQRTLRVNLRPGHYVLFCNMSGHFMGGMHTEVVVG